MRSMVVADRFGLGVVMGAALFLVAVLPAAAVFGQSVPTFDERPAPFSLSESPASVTLTPAGTGAAVVAEGAEAQIRLAGTSLGDNGVEFAGPAAPGVSFKPSALMQRRNSGTVVWSEAPADVAIEASGDTAIYANVYSGVDDVFVAGQGRLKHDVVLREKPEFDPTAAWFSAEVRMTVPAGWRIAATEVEIHTQQTIYTRDVTVISDNGKRMYRMPPIIVVDEAGETTSGRYRLDHLGGNEWLIGTEVEIDWLASAAYPVRIDPVLEVLNAAQVGFVTIFGPEYHHLAGPDYAKAASLYEPADFVGVIGEIRRFAWRIWFDQPLIEWPDVVAWVGEGDVPIDNMVATFDDNANIVPPIEVYDSPVQYAVAALDWVWLDMNTFHFYTGVNNFFVMGEAGDLPTLSNQNFTAAVDWRGTGKFGVVYGPPGQANGTPLDIRQNLAVDIFGPGVLALVKTDGVTVVGNNSVDDMGTITVGATDSLVYEIQNRGAAPLNMTGVPQITVENPLNCDVVVERMPVSRSLDAGVGVDFKLRVTPVRTGDFSFEIVIEYYNSIEDRTYRAYIEGDATGEAIVSLRDPQAREIVNGSDVELGIRPIETVETFQFTIDNLGTEVLEVKSLTVLAASNVNVVIADYPDGAVDPGRVTTFDLEMEVRSGNPFEVELALVTNDQVQGTYRFTIIGSGESAENKPPKNSCAVSTGDIGEGSAVALLALLVMALVTAAGLRRRS
jgi:hypothetical protein